MPMMTFQINTPRGPVEVSMSEFFDIVERRLSLKQVLLRRALKDTTSHSSI